MISKKTLMIIAAIIVLYIAYSMYSGAFAAGKNPFKNILGTPTLDVEKQLQSGMGSKDEPDMEVMELQKILNRHGATLVEDGVFGQLTQAALQTLTNGQYSVINIKTAKTFFNEN